LVLAGFHLGVFCSDHIQIKKVVGVFVRFRAPFNEWKILQKIMI
jgi:hypothetical protein